MIFRACAPDCAAAVDGAETSEIGALLHAGFGVAPERSRIARIDLARGEARIAEHGLLRGEQAGRDEAAEVPAFRVNAINRQCSAGIGHAQRPAAVLPGAEQRQPAVHTKTLRFTVGIFESEPARFAARKIRQQAQMFFRRAHEWRLMRRACDV
jgi:hypothetical protein